MGTPDVKKGVDHPDNRRFHELLERQRNFWVKVTCPERMSLLGPPYDDVVPFGRALVELLGHLTESRELGAAARERALQFTPRRAAEETLAFWRRLRDLPPCT